MRKQVYIDSLKDFTGGLNLRQDVFDLASNESPDMLNVDPDVRGGFQVRQGVKRLATGRYSGGNECRRLFYFETASVKSLILGANTSDTAYRISGPNIALTVINDTGRDGTVNDFAYAQALGNLYENGWTTTSNGSARKITSAWVSSALGHAFNDTGTPAGGNMPLAKTMVQHAGRMWVGNTLETGTQYPSRVRWSYASNATGDKGAEDWKTNSYIDINLGVSGDEITQLVPFGDRLFVFMRNSVHVITGFDDASFAVTTLSTEYGACGFNAAISTPAGIFFFDWPTGLNVITYDGTSRYLFDKILPIIQSPNGIPDTYQSLIALGYNARKVWVSVPYGPSAVDNNRTYVLDLGVGSGTRFGMKTPISEGRQGGAWTMYDYGIGAFKLWQPTGADAYFVGMGCDQTNTNRRNQLLQLTDTGLYQDDFDSSADTHIDAYLVTPWITLGVPTSPKRFRRSWFVMKADPTVGAPRVFCDVYKDYDDSIIYKTFEITPQVTIVSGNAGAGSLIWGTDLWGTGLWGGAAATVASTNYIVKAATLGNAHAVRLRISCSQTLNALSTDQRMWGMDAVDMRYTPRRIR